jgi:hypothetical protein
MASPRFTAKPINLSDDRSGKPRTPESRGRLRAQRERKIFGLLEIDAEDAQARRAIDRIERSLGAYSAFIENVDQAPTPAEYSSAYAEVAAKTLALFQRLEHLDPYISEALEAKLHTGALDSQQLALYHLWRAADDLTKEYKRDSGGRPESHAEPYTVANLRAIFREFYGGRVEPREERAFTKRKPWERSEAEFVKFTLDVIGVRPKNLDRKMRDDPRYMPLAMRERKLEAIAKGVSKDRRKGAVPDKSPPSRGTLAAELEAVSKPKAKTPRRPK